MPIVVDKDCVTVEEQDPWYRALCWTYKKGQYHRTIWPSVASPGEISHTETSAQAFAGAFWREWKLERGI